MNWALIGYGGMGKWHVEKLATLDFVNICGIWDVREERRALAEQNGLHVFVSLEALLADEAVEVVTIATPNDLHRPLAIQAMQAGKHVVSEKPVTLSCDDLQAMIDCSRDTGKLFTVHQNRRWDEDFLVVKRITMKTGWAACSTSNPACTAHGAFPATGTTAGCPAAAWCWTGACTCSISC